MNPTISKRMTRRYFYFITTTFCLCLRLGFLVCLPTWSHITLTINCTGSPLPPKSDCREDKFVDPPVRVLPNRLTPPLNLIETKNIRIIQSRFLPHYFKKKHCRDSRPVHLRH